jgi:hypothetical protein
VSQPQANVNVGTDTFNDFITKFNQVALALSTVVFTANSSIANNVGDAYLQGILQSDTLVAGVNGIRGGNVLVSNTLLVTSPISYNNLASDTVGLASFSTNAAGQVVDSFPTNTNRTAKYVLQVNTSIGYQATEILVLQDGNNVTMTEYATITSNGTLATFSANLASNTLTLYANPIPSVSTVTFRRSAISV